MPKTDFPEKGDDREISLRNSQYRQFDFGYAKSLKENYPEIWNKGGNIRGNEAFSLWGKARGGSSSESVKSWIKEREAWIARHHKDFRLAGVVAQIKWGAVGSRGMEYMKRLVDDAKDKAKKGVDVNIEVKECAGFVSAISDDEITYKGVKSGRVDGYLATWDKDRGNDIFHRGAFVDSIAEMKARKRDLRLKDSHGRTIGVFDHSTLREDDKGLFGVGYINLEVQQGREAHSLAKQGAYDSFSVGFSVPRGGSKGEFPYGRDIYKADLWETSVVDEPMNPHAQMTSVKSVTGFQDLPLADAGKSWDASKAEKRVRAWANADDEPNGRYRKAFLWHDADEPESFTSYKFPIADVVDGELKAVPRAIYAAAAALQGARGGATISDEDKSKMRRHLDRYYDKLGKDSPWGEKMIGEILGDTDEIKEMTVRQIEQALIDGGASKDQAKTLISTLKKSDSDDDDDNEQKGLDDLFSALDGISSKF